MVSKNLDINYNNIYNITYNNSYFFFIKNNNKEGIINIMNKKIIISFRLKGTNITIKYNNDNITFINITPKYDAKVVLKAEIEMQVNFIRSFLENNLNHPLYNH